MTTHDDRPAIALRAILASLTGDSSVIGQLFAADVRASVPAPVTYAAALAVEFEDRRDAFANVELTVASLECRDARTWVEWTAAVTAASGCRGEVHGVTVIEFLGNRIVGFRQYSDSGVPPEQEPR